MKYFSEDYKITKESSKVETIEGSGGGSCFPTGTLVRTAYGFKRIEYLQIGDMVVAYDRYGNLEHGYIVDKPVHTEYEDKIYFLKSGEEQIFSEGITGNHAVYDIKTGEHKVISEFVVGDKLRTVSGDIEITEIYISEEKPTVYNLIIDPHHTYLVGLNQVFVHNGGKGKGGSSTARAAIEAPNTLQSSAVIKSLEIVSHGEIEDFIGGLKGIFYNATPIQDTSGSNNFENVVVEYRKGPQVDGIQTIIPGFEETEQETTYNATEVVTEVIASVPDTNVKRLRVTLDLPDGLWKQDKTNGDLNGHTVSYTISVKTQGLGTFSQVVSKTLNDKAVSAVELAHIIDSPTGAPITDIKVTRTSPLDYQTDSGLRSKIRLVRITELYQTNLAYDKVALVGHKIPASSVGNSVPVRSYLVKGIKVPVPSNFNPVTRTYSGGYWDLSFGIQNLWTDDPAWVLRDIIMNDEYGLKSCLGMDIIVDDNELFLCSMYNNCVTWNPQSGTYSQNLISDGQGGYEVRFTANGTITTQLEAWHLIQAIASTMRAIAVQSGNIITFIQDRPKPIKRFFNNTSVVEGKFHWKGIESTSQKTAVNCTYNDKNDRYLPKTISEPSAETMQSSWYNYIHTRLGWNVADIVAYMCTSESQARRMAKYALYTEVKQPKLCSFTTGLNIIGVKPGERVQILDDHEVYDDSQYYSGRIVSISGTSVTFPSDSAITLLAGHTYTIGVIGLDAKSFVERTIISPAGTYTTITVDSAFPAGDYSNKEYMIQSPGIATAVDIIVQNIKPNDDSTFLVSGVLYDENKYAAVEDGIIVPPVDVDRSLSPVLPSVSNIQIEEIYMNSGIDQKKYLNISWDWEPATYNDGTGVKPYTDQVSFSIQYRRDKNNFTTINGILGKNYKLADVVPGVYEFRFIVENIQGKKSLAEYATFNYRTITGQSSLIAPTNFYVQGTTSTTFTSPDLAMSWTYPASNDNKLDTLKQYIVEIWDIAETTKKGSYIIEPIRDKFLADGTTANPLYKGGKFTYFFAQNMHDNGTAQRSIKVKLYSQDMAGDLSIATTKTFTNPAPVVPAFEVSGVIDAAYLKATIPSDTDLVSFTFSKYAAAAGGTPIKTITTINNFVDFEATSGTTYYYTVTPNDSFGPGTESTRQSGTAISATVDIYTYNGLVFTPNSPSNNSVSWSSFIAYKNGVNIGTISAGSAAWTTGTLYVYLVPGNTTLSSNTDPLVAVAAGGRILATYKGGTNLTADEGRAFISGDQLIAGSLLANALATNTAYITNFAQIGNILQSYNYVNGGGVYTGWRIDKGGAANFNSITVRDSFGNIIFSTGTGMAWSAVTGTGRPENNATVGANSSNLQAGVGTNLLNNTTFLANLDTWSYYSDAGGPVAGFVRIPPGDNGSFGAYGALEVWTNNLTGQTSNSSVHTGNLPLPCYPGQRIEAQARIKNYRINAKLQISFQDASGTYLGSFDVTGGVLATDGNSPSWTAQVSESTLLWGFVTAPANAAKAYLEVRLTNAFDNYPGIFIGLPYLGYATGAQTSPSTWSAGTPVGAFSNLNKITSANSTTFIDFAAINAAQIGSIALVGTNNFSVKSGISGRRMELDSTSLIIWDESNIDVVRIGLL